MSFQNMTLSFRTEKQVMCSYLTSSFQNLIFLNLYQNGMNDTPHAVVFVANNQCNTRSHREKFVTLLKKYVQVDSVSGCLHNKNWPQDIPRSDTIRLLERSKVYMVAENSIDNDYVSEKVYDGLVAGAVPIYLGAPNVEGLYSIKLYNNCTDKFQ